MARNPSVGFKIKVTFKMMANKIRLACHSVIAIPVDPMKTSYADYMSILRKEIVGSWTRQGCPKETLDWLMHEMGGLFMEGRHPKDYAFIYILEDRARHAMIYGLDLDLVMVKFDGDSRVVKGVPHEVLCPEDLHDLKVRARASCEEIRGKGSKPNPFFGPRR